MRIRERLQFLTEDKFLSNNLVFFSGSLVAAFGSYIFQSLMARFLSVEDYGRFQSLVAAALERHPRFLRLHNNRGAGQPDCHHDPSGYGFEIKCRKSDQPLVLDDNSWNALETYRHRRLVTLLAASVPYPLWVVDLAGWSRRPIALTRISPADLDLEAYLAAAISDVVEEVGAGRMSDPRRIETVAGEESRLRSEADGRA